METAASSRASVNMLDCLINHVALPPQLPGKREDNLIQIEEKLLMRFQNAARTLGEFDDNGLGNHLDFVRLVLEKCKILNARRKLDRKRLLGEFEKLRRDVPLILHVTEQNAGLIVWRQFQ